MSSRAKEAITAGARPEGSVATAVKPSSIKVGQFVTFRPSRQTKHPMDHPSRTERWSFLIALLILAVLSVGSQRYSSPATEWIMVNVSDHPAQADAHLIRAGKLNILIDVGTEQGGEEVLVPYLRSLGVRQVDHVFITHPHKDHYGGLNALLDAGIPMKRVYFLMPYKPQCDAEIPWGCDWLDVRATMERFHREGTYVTSARAGTRVQLSSQAHLDVLYTYDGIHTPVGPTDINDLSLIMRLTHGPTSVMFTGDLNQVLGEYLATQGNAMKATLLKVPHHGAEGLAPDTFFDAVNPEEAMVPAHASLWCDERSKRTRTWMSNHHVVTHVNGIHGHVSTLMLSNGRHPVVREFDRSPEICPS